MNFSHQVDLFAAFMFHDSADTPMKLKLTSLWPTHLNIPSSPPRVPFLPLLSLFLFLVPQVFLSSCTCIFLVFVLSVLIDLPLCYWVPLDILLFPLLTQWGSGLRGILRGSHHRHGEYDFLSLSSLYRDKLFIRPLLKQGGRYFSPSLWILSASEAGKITHHSVPSCLWGTRKKPHIHVGLKSTFTLRIHRPQRAKFPVDLLVYFCPEHFQWWSVL